MVRVCALILSAGVFAGCAMSPRGPNIPTFVGTGIPYDIYLRDKVTCEQQAIQTEQESPEGQAAMRAALGGLLGAGLGAAVGAATGSPSAGAAIGGTTGVVLGAASGTNAAQSMAQQQQLRMNHTFASCMFAYGHQVPGVHLMSR